MEINAHLFKIPKDQKNGVIFDQTRGFKKVAAFFPAKPSKMTFFLYNKENLRTWCSEIASTFYKSQKHPKTGVFKILKGFQKGRRTFLSPSPQ